MNLFVVSLMDEMNRKYFTGTAHQDIVYVHKQEQADRKSFRRREKYNCWSHNNAV